ncbi:Oxidoreductase ptaJ like protein [Verticillium longisporum]|nr:Oxidoreductase ptaJ like protein [Verticillium longisporum]
MATAYKIHVSKTNTGLLKFDQPEATAAKTTELLQSDLENHHVFFNQSGYHNHIVHHLLALYGTGASPDSLNRAYETNTSYQRAARPIHPALADSLATSWSETAPRLLGKEAYYPDFLLFFQRELESHGIGPVLKEFIFAKDERAEDLFQRLFAGFLHPLIQLMYGIEWEQPAIVAEGLAQAAVHKNQLGPFLKETEEGAAGEMPSIQELHEAIAKRVKIKTDELGERTAEMFETTFWVAAGAALRKGKDAKWDFFLIHHTNSAPFFVALNKTDWISVEDKVRILEYKIRLDLVQNAARGTPEIRFDAIAAYRPKDLDRGKALVARPEDLLPRFHAIDDDGHTVKVARSLAVCRELCEPYADRPWKKVKSDDVWLKMHYTLLDGTEGGEEEGGRWVRAAGFDESWEDVPNRL